MTLQSRLSKLEYRSFASAYPLQKRILIQLNPAEGVAIAIFLFVYKCFVHLYERVLLRNI